MGHFYASGERQAAATANLSVPWPPHIAGDVGLLIVHTNNDAVATPSGWEALTPQGDGTAGAAGSTGLTCFVRRAADGSEANVSVATSALNHASGIILTFRGLLDTEDVLDVIDVQGGDDTDGSASTSLVIPSITTTEDGCVVVVIGSNATDSGTNQVQTYPGITNATLEALVRRDHVGSTFGAGSSTQVSNGNGGGFIVATGRMVTAGATGTTSATLATSSLQARVAIAFKSAPAGSGGGLLTHPGMAGGING